MLLNAPIDDGDLHRFSRDFAVLSCDSNRDTSLCCGVQLGAGGGVGFVVYGQKRFSEHLVSRPLHHHQ